MRIRTLTIVGVGLIGGSIGLAARRRGLAERVVGVGRQQATLDRALALEAITETCTDLTEGVRQADLVVFCTPVDLIADQIRVCAPACRPGTLITDAGSTKAALVQAVDGNLPKGISFVGSHPLAGSEKRGPEHAMAGLFEGRVTVVTPTAKSDPEAVARTRAFWEALGSRVVLLNPEAHDQALAMTSHLPHLLASALAGVLPDDLRPLTATGFRDTTRVAGGDPALWTAIFLQNRMPLLKTLETLRGQMDAFQHALTHADGPAIDALLAQGKRNRDALGN